MKFRLTESCLFEAKNIGHVIKGVIFTAKLNNYEPFIEFSESFKITQLDHNVYHVYMILRDNFVGTHSSLDEWLAKNKIQHEVKAYYVALFLKESDRIELDISDDYYDLEYGDQLYEAAQMFYDFYD